mmetsp:Transcript_39791/g.106135  ORF Transcript_39791/g.106135 Transcript_39791/m.106135 type:complete len:751 (+) Transcript_39791:75-2327(+)
MTMSKDTKGKKMKREQSLVDSIVGERAVEVSTCGLLYRQAKVFHASLGVFLDYKLCQWSSNRLPDEEEEKKDSIWDRTHERNSKYLCKKFIGLEGLWVKLGQYLSSRADVMPPSYLEALSKCQDSLPARPFSEIKALLEKELGGRIEEHFEHVDPVPIACASIAQVHRARLVGGREVVIKAQHGRVAKRLLQDLKNLETLCDLVRRLEPDFDFSPVVREWAREIPGELDFRREAGNQRRVERNLAYLRPANAARLGVPDALAIDVTFPQIIDGLFTERVLVMSYIDGFKVNDMAKLDEHKADRVRIVDHVTRAYAHQIFVDGFYSADPHPGNILVDRTTLMPVLLDFGLTKELDAHTRYNFARLLVAVAEQDMHGLLDALEGVGLKLRPDVPFDAALLARYFFRDAKTQAVARAESQQRRADLRRRVAEAARHVYAGDRVDVKLRGFLGTKSRKGEVLWVGDGHVRVKLTNGEEKEVPRDAVRLQAGRSPIDAWPDSFIFFDRVLGLLRGLTAALNVTQSYLDVMVPYARRALESHDAPGADEQKTIKAAPSAPIVGAPGEHLPAAHAQVSAAVSTPAADAAMPLSAVAVALPGFGVGGVDRLGGISELVQELIDSEDVLGCQVCVLRNGEPIVDLWGGRLSPYDRRPVARDSLFNCFSVTKGVVTAAVLSLVQQGRIDLSAPVAKYWPAFAAEGKDKITVEQVLNHQAGLANAGLEELARDPFLVADADAMLQILATATPEIAPGSETR